MNPVKLKFRHGGEMLVSPIGLRFVEDPDHGPLVLIPELSGPRAYQLDMTLEEAEQALVNALRGGRTSEWWAAVIDLQQAVGEFGGRLSGIEARLGNLSDDYHTSKDSDEFFWQALQIHLGLPEGWEHLNEEAAEVKGALVSQAEEIDELKRELSLLKEEASLFTLAERVGELEESRSLQLKRLANLLEDNERIRRWIIDESLKTSEAIARIEQLESWKSEVHPELNRDTVFPMLDDRVCVQKTVTVPPITIAWSKDGPVDAFTGKPIAVESWTAPQVGEPSSAMFDRLRAVEKREGAAFPAIDDRATAWSGDWWDTVPTGLRGGVNYYDRDKSVPEKPKSAWKPLMDCDSYGIYMIRHRKQRSGYLLQARRNFAGWEFDTKASDFSTNGWDPNRYPEHYEFCPIPE